MNILYVSGCFDMGGTEIYTLNFAKGMMNAGHTVYWATKEKGLMRSVAEEQGIKLLHWQTERRNPVSVLRGMTKIRTIVKKNNIDIIHFTDAFPAMICSIALKVQKNRPCLIWSNVGIGTKSYGLMNKICGRNFDCILAVSQYIRNRMIEVGFMPDCVKVHVGTRNMMSPTQNRETVRMDYGVKGDDILIGSVGRVVYAKGNHTLVQALPRVIESVPTAKLMIVGDGPERDRLIKMAYDLGVSERVIITGYKQDVENYYPAFDIVAFPTFSEALGYIPMEAWSYRKPLIASYTGGIPEIVREGYNGMLVPPGDIMQWGDAIIRLITNKEMQTSLVQGGTEYYQMHMTYERSVSLLEQIYKEVMGNKHFLEKK